MNTQRHQSAARVTSPGTAWQPGFGAKKVNTRTDLGYSSTELVQPKCLRGKRELRVLARDWLKDGSGDLNQQAGRKGKRVVLGVRGAGWEEMKP